MNKSTTEITRQNNKSSMTLDFSNFENLTIYNNLN